MSDNTFKKFSNFYVQAVQVFEKNREDYSVSIQPIVNVLIDFNNLLCRDYKNLKWVEEFFKDYFDDVQKCFINMHFLLCDDKRDIEIRLLAGQSIIKLLKEIPIDVMRRMVLPIVPGLLNNFSEAAIGKGTNTNGDIVINCLTLIENVVMITYNDWIEKRGSQFDIILKKIVSNLTTHKKHEVRLKILTMLQKFSEEFKTKFPPINNITTEVSINIYNDENDTIKKEVNRIITKNMELNRSSFIRHLTKELNTSLDKLSLSSASLTTKSQLDISRELIRIHNLIVILGPTYLSTILSFSTKLTDNIVSILHVNIDKVTIVTENENDVYENSQEFFNSIEFRNNVRNDLLLNICDVLVRSGNVNDLFNGVLDIVNVSNVDGKISYFILCLGLLLKLEPNNSGQYNSSLLLLLDISIENLKKYENFFEIKEQDKEISNDIFETSKESFLVSLLLIIGSETISRIHSKLEHVDLINSFYYTLLTYSFSNNTSIRQVAGLSINILTGPDFYRAIPSLVFLCNCNLKDYTKCSRASNVLSGLIYYFKDKKDCCINLYEETKYIVEDILLTLDHGNQTRIFNLLKTLFSFVNASVSWFGEIKSTYNYEKDDEEILPEVVILIHKILTRTKHLILSDFLPIQVIVFDIMRDGLYFCRNFRSRTLPIIYGNWQSIRFKITRLQSEYMEALKNPIIFLVAAKAISVISYMTELSNTFMYQKVNEIITSITYAMKETAKKSSKADPVYCYSQMFEFQKSVFISIPIFVKYFKLSHTEEMSKKFIEICEMYINDKFQPKLLIDKAINGLKLFDNN
uniref:HEAT repeat-containing protein 1 n=1 Tax=Strongyloides papillosus TaxID=174720 RepID=A0A0N5B9T4_STREA